VLIPKFDIKAEPKHSWTADQEVIPLASDGSNLLVLTESDASSASSSPPKINQPFPDELYFSDSLMFALA
jgi:hypothetical protein